MKEEWKVFIRGNKDRGEEVIKTLTDLGGRGDALNGSNKGHIYFIDHDGTIDFEYLNSETAKIIMDDYKEIKLSGQWKDGDLLVHTDDDGSTEYAVYKETEEFNEYTQPYCILTYASVNKHVYGINTIVFKDEWKLASNEEHKEFYDLLHKHGKDWDTEKRELVDWKWKPKEGDDYWTVIVGIANKLKFTWFGTKADEARYKLGNCFKTREEAEVMAEKVKNLFLQNYEKTKENS